MSKFEQIKQDSNIALKQGNKARRLILADICASIEKASITDKSRVEITDDFVDSVLIKYQKTVQEMIDTCPRTEQYEDRLNEYRDKLVIVKEYAPKLLDNYADIEDTIMNWIISDTYQVPFDNKGAFMKFLVPKCKAAKMDMKIASKVLNDLWDRCTK